MRRAWDDLFLTRQICTERGLLAYADTPTRIEVGACRSGWEWKRGWHRNKYLANLFAASDGRRCRQTHQCGSGGRGTFTQWRAGDTSIWGIRAFPMFQWRPGLRG